jgi:uncharacterized membrane protein
MIAKCQCHLCQNAIEFEVENAGASIPCPHCGELTVLALPAKKPALRSSQSGGGKVPWKLLVGMAAVVALLAFIYGMTRSEKLQAVAEAFGIAGGGIIMMALVVVAFLIVLLWILFPVFVYFAIGRMEKIMREIEHNTRK